MVSILAFWLTLPFIIAEERLNNDLEDYFAKAEQAENGADAKDAAAKVEEEKKE